ncbi:bis(5'-nucleosyl)-tetraphosphatase (symmetrical) YqeK [Ruminococcus sp. Marseille-P6503]|uniref:bis(5'-nucleosyl)-tetraphosphatase (symmetrical) YqeK n=1 Tax=Ruminococcus sp. Marseille-P6503 TaxID=2364796 RepID=UPI000F546EA7|nr:bis(5'-nucleosyl)-tetraphosphatase (symmetrical) YqeK [Ruminococcus sp. Marseille-P6503]
MADKKLIGQYKNYLKENLSKKRYTHSVNVANAASKLAERYGGNKEKAYLAGLLHDICKETPEEKQLELVKQSKLDVCAIETKTPALYHAIAGAEFIQSEFQITDTEIVDAVRYHTVGRKDMPLLSQIIYLADLISDDRDYKDVKKMRRYAEQSLEKAMLEALKFSIADSVEKGNMIPVSTLECYNDFAKLKNK